MHYLSVCSGIEAASAAWGPLGWNPVAFSEIEKFPSQVLSHHFGSNMPDEPLSGNAPPNLGDMNKFREWPDYANLDVLVGGTPCQSFSVAGLRKGLADPRGNLALVYLGIADRYRPEWLLWENVPGVLSSSDGRDFGSFLGGMVELGYSFAYRVLDAQYIRIDGFGRAVPQRRRRVFVVGHSDWRRAAAVLFEPASLRGDSPPGRQSGQGVAPTIAARTRGGGGLGTDFDCDGGLITFGGNNCLGPIDVATAVNVHGGPNGRQDFESETFVVAPKVAASQTRGGESSGKGGYAGRRQEDDVNLVAHSLRDEGFDASEDGTGRGTPIVPVSFGGQMSTPMWDFDLSQTLQAKNPQAVAFDMRGREGGAQFEGPHQTANIRAASGGSSRSYIAQQWAVRRLMPMECERLQGFPDGYTDIPMPNGKPAADGPRYKALGNSMAVNVIRWLGRRIDMVRAIP